MPQKTSLGGAREIAGSYWAECDKGTVVTVTSVPNVIVQSLGMRDNDVHFSPVAYGLPANATAPEFRIEWVCFVVFVQGGRSGQVDLGNLRAGMDMCPSHDSPHHASPHSSHHSVVDRAFQYYPQLEKVKLYIESHYSEDISLQQVAQVAGMEKTYFSKFFRTKVGVTFRSWLSRTRVEKAMDLIRRRNLNICEVACSVGFLELRTFERTFKRCTGLTPRDFKRRARPC